MPTARVFATLSAKNATLRRHSNLEYEHLPTRDGPLAWQTLLEGIANYKVILQRETKGLGFGSPSK